ncbi:MAG TPA: PilZ domain-containing protein [Woeseiaceae bacterium]|nr:PilZ domain-containing protein [Woeseiaceae bacterium]
MNEPEKRRSFRVREPVYLRYEILSDLDFHEGLERRKLRHGFGAKIASTMAELDARLNEELQRLRGEPSIVGRCLNLLNEKLNIVVNEMPEMRKIKSDLASLRPQTCEISADGIVFSAPQALAIGTKLYVEFLLESDNRFVDAFGVVIRDTEPPDDSNAELPFGVAIEFHGMKPELRETLIQHMFSRESETLRMRRLELRTS